MAFVFLDGLPIYQEISEFIYLLEIYYKKVFNREWTCIKFTVQGKCGNLRNKNMRKLWEVNLSGIIKQLQITTMKQDSFEFQTEFFILLMFISCCQFLLFYTYFSKNASFPFNRSCMLGAFGNFSVIFYHFILYCVCYEV